MFENNVPGASSRGRGRGRGSYRDKYAVKDRSSVLVEETIARSNQRSQQTQDSQLVGHQQTSQQLERDDISSLKAADSFQASFSPNKPPSNFNQNIANSSATVSSTNESAPPRPLLSLKFSSIPVRKPCLANRDRTRTGNWPERCSQNMKQTYHNYHQKIFTDSSRDRRRPLPQQRNIIFDNPWQGQSQRVPSKRPVSSPTSGSRDSALQQKLSPTGHPQCKKKKKKKKTESDPTTSKYGSNKDFVNTELFELQVSEEKTFTEQTYELISQLEQTESERKMRLQVLKDVQETVSFCLPFVEPQIFGSTLTNLAFKSSDLDIFLYCPNGQPEYNFVSEKGWIMYKSPKFKNVVRVPRARVPVIKATHKATNIDIDISTISGQAVHNSMLIKYILCLDIRFRPLAMLISLWCKLNVITGHSRFTSYSIILMFVYFLQNQSPPLLPPLKDILYTNDENEWPSFFTKNPLKNENSSDIPQLFKEFFIFYAKFNFEQFIISPYLAKEIPIKHFQNVDNLNDDYKIYKNKLANNSPFKLTNVIHVQDPIEHNVNTTKGVFPRLLKLFKRSVERFLNSCNDNVPQNRWLPVIIKQSPLKLVDEKKTEFIINYPSNEKTWFENLKLDFRKFLKILLLEITEENVESKTDSENQLYTDSFLAESCYNVFSRKFRNSLKMYMSDAIDLEKLQREFEIVVSRTQSLVVLFKTRFVLEEENATGRVKVTITDKNSTGLNSFPSMALDFKHYYGKFLNDIISKRKSTISDSSECLNKNVDSNTCLESTNKTPDEEVLEIEGGFTEIKDITQ